MLSDREWEILKAGAIKLQLLHLCAGTGWGVVVHASDDIELWKYGERQARLSAGEALRLVHPDHSRRFENIG